MDTYHPAYSKGAFMAVGSEMKKILPMQIPTITTTKQINGAIAMFYPGVKEKIAQMAGGFFYAAFTSIHDVRIHCDKSIPPRHILQNLKSVNAQFDAKLWAKNVEQPRIQHFAAGELPMCWIRYCEHRRCEQ